MLVLPITHRPPEDARFAVQIPAIVKWRLRLDGAQSWVVISEWNDFISGRGPDLRRLPDRGRFDCRVRDAAAKTLRHRPRPLSHVCERPRGGARAPNLIGFPPSRTASRSPRNRGPRRHPLSRRRWLVFDQRRARQMAGRGLRRRATDDAALDRRRRRARADRPRVARQPHRSAPGTMQILRILSQQSTRSLSTTRRASCRSPT